MKNKIISTNFRIQSKSVFLIYSQCDLTVENVKNQISEKVTGKCSDNAVVDYILSSEFDKSQNFASIYAYFIFHKKIDSKSVTFFDLKGYDAIKKQEQNFHSHKQINESKNKILQFIKLKSQKGHLLVSPGLQLCVDSGIWYSGKKADSMRYREKARKEELETGYSRTKACAIRYREKVKQAKIKSGNWSPARFLKTEKILFKKMTEHYPSLLMQFTPSWVAPKRYDFSIPELKIIIELDGEQHFKLTWSKWASPQEQLKNDKFKQKCANDNGYSTIRILQVDVFRNKRDWQSELIRSIEKIKVEGVIQNVYICKKNEYHEFTS